MKHLRLLVLLAVGAALLPGCSGMSVHTDYDRAADFASYKTFAWMKPDADTPHANQIIENRIRRAVVDALAAKGFTETQEKPDLYVTYMAMVEEKVDVSTTTYGYWRGSALGEVDVYRYNQGTLILDMVDAADNQLVWRGTGTGVVGQSVGDPEKIRKAVDGILKDFPPK